jgi:hypothetical protein
MRIPLVLFPNLTARLRLFPTHSLLCSDRQQRRQRGKSRSADVDIISGRDWDDDKIPILYEDAVSHVYDGSVYKSVLRNDDVFADSWACNDTLTRL